MSFYGLLQHNNLSILKLCQCSILHWHNKVVLCCYLNIKAKARCFINRLQSVVGIAKLAFTNMLKVMREFFWNIGIGKGKRFLEDMTCRSVADSCLHKGAANDSKIPNTFDEEIMHCSQLVCFRFGVWWGCVGGRHPVIPVGFFFLYFHWNLSTSTEVILAAGTSVHWIVRRIFKAETGRRMIKIR